MYKDYTHPANWWLRSFFVWYERWF